eukprot:Awhi_evm1s1032
MLRTQYKEWVLEHLSTTNYTPVTTANSVIKLTIIMKIKTLVNKYTKLKEFKIILHEIEKTELPYFYAQPKVHKVPM